MLRSCSLLPLALCLSMAGWLVAQDTRQAAPKTPDQPLAEEVHLPQWGIAVLIPTRGSKVTGRIMFEQQDEGLQLSGTVRGLEPGKHGFHIHEYGDLSDPEGKAAGGHFNPSNQPHGGPDDPEHHAGDLGNITADENGVAKIDMQVPWLKLHFILGRGLVVHAGADDLESQPSGDAGGRQAVGVIGIAQPMNNQAPTTSGR